MAPTFPLLFGREGGLETDILKLLTLENGAADLHTIRSMEKVYSNLKQKIVEILSGLIGMESREMHRNKLLTFKRDIYNNRNLSKYNKVTAEYETLRNAVDAYISFSTRIEKVKEQFGIAFESQLETGIRTLQDALSRHALSNGILFSSCILHDELKKNILLRVGMNKSGRNLILTATKYLTRSATKTTPFSSLNGVFAMELIGRKYRGIDFSDRESRIQISNLVYFRAREMLLSSKKFIGQLEVTVNKAIFLGNDNEEYIHFFLNTNNSEFFKKVKRTEVITEILELAKLPIRYSDFVDLIAARFSQTIETVDEYLTGLVDLGIVHIKFPVGLDDMEWVSTLIKYIDSRRLNFDANILEVRDFLRDLKAASLKIESTSDISKRRTYIEECSVNLTNSLNADRSQNYLNELARSGSLFYENVFANADSELEAEDVESVQGRILEVFFVLNNNFLKKRTRLTLSKCVQGVGGKVPLLRAYEEFYLGNGNLAEAEGTDFDRLIKLVHNVTGALNEHGPERPVDIFQFLDNGQIFIDDHVRFGTFIQTVDPRFEEIVINSFSNGFGSNISRYLGFCPPQIVDKCRKYIADLNQHSVIADVRDASIHNASSFPVLSDHTMDIAGNCSNEFGNLIPLNALYLSIGDHENVIISNEYGVKVNPVNFSMEALARRSKFTQFLELFNDTELFGYKYFLQRIGEFLISASLEKNVVASPRVVFKSKVTLKRRQWHIKTKFLLVWIGECHGLAHLFCMRMNEFLSAHSIPREVFVKFGQIPRAGSGHGDDRTKPQYIDFTSPLLVILFMNMLGKSDHVIELSEVFPSFNSYYDQSNGRVKEYVMNF
ncbi:lantibiotic dehydratase [Dyadobacter arcticus]|uniref:Lantibiotic dehydratase N-terminal domain-containing protein n=1 Tax=Dyadobacter arcticus TaxID=1078754 RepID=A0ABX0UJ07_9BACT|nr:lantibiotic dehydratase [Dyadobacter arcticus]NIJ52981.1 hypothetical protein [Dyadobacter arcticus]